MINLNKSIACALFLGASILLLFSCEEVVLLGPPEPGEGSGEQSGTGRSRGKGLIFSQNEITEQFNGASNPQNVTLNNVADFVTDNGFARPIDAAITGFDFENLPTWVGPIPEIVDGQQGQNGPILQDVNDYNDADIDLEQTDYLGAFDRNVQPEWHAGSKWFDLDPSDNDYEFDPNDPSLITIDEDITSDQTWTADHNYLITGQTFVKEGVTLTIEPGTIIYGNRAVGPDAGVLCINRGAKIMAEGTPDQPIIFTSISPRSQRSRGDWGGIIICGHAYNTREAEVLIEGIEVDNGIDGVYGFGSRAEQNNEENSGVFRFVRIEYAGVALTPGNEINSLTLGSVGSGTQVDHIAIISAGDDGIECFGGRADLRYILTYNVLDDDLDLDQGYKAAIQYAYLIRNPFAGDESGSTSFETSSTKTTGNFESLTEAVAANITIVGPNYMLDGFDDDPAVNADRLYEGGFLGKDNSEADLINSLLIGTPIGFQNP